MNILFVWTSPFKDGGGVGRVTTTLGEEFMRRGHKVCYFSFCQGEEYVHNGIPQLFSPENKKPTSPQNTESLKRVIVDNEIGIIINQAGGSDPNVLKVANKVISKLELKEKIKIFTVHHNCIKGVYNSFELILKNNFKTHWIYPIIANVFFLKILKLRHKFKFKRIMNDLIHYSDYWVLLSENFIHELQIYSHDFNKDKVISIPNPVPFESKDVEHKKENRLVFVGRINFEQKRADLLIQLWKKLYLKYPDWELDVVGDGEVLDELKRKAKNENLDRIHFHGYQDPVPFLEKAKFFVMTSAFEGFPMVLVEAQAYGVVPFAFDSFSSVHDIISNYENGVIIPAFQLDKYVEKLGELMVDEGKRINLSQKARNSVTKFNPSNIANEWERLFRNEDLLEWSS